MGVRKNRQYRTSLCRSPESPPLPAFSVRKKSFHKRQKSYLLFASMREGAPLIESHCSNEKSDKIQTFFLNHKLAVPGTCGG
jgi:hypothetical protein